MDHKIITSVPASVLAYISTTPEKKAPVMIVTPDGLMCEKLFKALCALKRKEQHILMFPEWDSAPEYQNSPDIDIQSNRISSIYSIGAIKDNTILVTSLPAISLKMVPSDYISRFSKKITINTKIDRDLLSIDLVSSGYERMDIVDSVGQFSIKGNLIDIYSPYHEQPFRIELVGEYVDLIKFFNPSTQRTISKTNDVTIIPAREISFSEQSIQLFKERFKEHCDKNHIRKDIREQITDIVDNKVYFPGIEYFMPFFHESLSTIHEHLPKDTEVFFYDEHLFEELKPSQPSDSDVGLDSEGSIPYPLKDLYLAGRHWEKLQEKNITKVYSIEYASEDDKEVNSISLKEDVKEHELLKGLKHHGAGSVESLKEFHKQKKAQGYRIIYTCRTEHQAERLIFILGDSEKDIRIFKNTTLNELIYDKEAHTPAICISDLPEGFTLRSKMLWVISENEIFGEKHKNIEPSKQQDAFLNLFKELKLNDYVVHSKHGVGIYRGLFKMEIDGIESDYFQIEYSGHDLLLLPVHRLSSVQRYIAQGGHKAVLDKLGGATWNKKRSRAKKATMDIAHKLIKLQSERALNKGYSFSPPDEIFYRFESEFEFEETNDQLKAINDVMSDMESPKAMDRLVCGDVGFGKTEVAIRAAFKAVKDGKQVAVLAPTTVLSFQHFRIFQKRFQDYPVNIELLTRFKTTKEQKQALSKLEAGKVDIIIGTHRLISRDIKFKDLGLLIVDEEHRFGVQQKERIKEISKNVDAITMTATPIPRTLNMALVGLKDISIITTPPVNRLPIKTFVSKFSSKLIRKAVMYELKRGGQVFFLHNRIQDLEEIHKKLKEIVPEANITVAHGQMGSKDLEEKMISFYNREADVLLSTSIIESGIDIPNANTIIINRADMFGLSQLYQIRGRVGRSPSRAFCYLLVPSNFMIGKSAMERIKTLQRFTELGSGFNIASYDLEFRGAGEILGSSQSGFIEDIGLEEYLKLIQEAVDDLKGEEHRIEERIEPEISINIPAFIPEDYMSDVGQRLYFYKKLSNARSSSELLQIEEEIKDRYGDTPEELKNLLSLMEIKILLAPLNVSNIKIGSGKLVYSFLSNTRVVPEVIVEMVTKQPDKYRITPDMKLISNIDDNDWRSAIKEIRNFISRTGLL